MVKRRGKSNAETFYWSSRPSPKALGRAPKSSNDEENFVTAKFVSRKSSHMSALRRNRADVPCQEEKRA